MKIRAERDLSRIGILDYVLMSLGSCLAVHSAGLSIQQPAISYYCVVLVILGTCVSYGIRVASIRSPFIKFDALFYGVGVVCSIVFSNELRTMMPEDGFPREIAAAGWLSWMIILGSFATWQDSTLLFQAIPALALFGLVGCYDTYRGATIEFFAFVICLATLFARAHGREMLRKAAESGYFTRGLAPGSPIPSVDTTPGLALKLKQGPWRWLAGPEWALFSALAVVLVSLLGAPVIRRSVSGVAGFVHINPPTTRPRPTNPAQNAGDVSGQSVRIGRPYNHVLSRPLIEAKLDHLRYLRAETYNSYTGHGWQNSVGLPSVPSDPNTIQLMVQGQMKGAKPYTFELRTLRSLHLLPVPTEVTNLDVENATATEHTDGTFELSTAAVEGTTIKGTSTEVPPGTPPTHKFSPPELEPYVDLTSVSARVRQMAEEVSKGKKTDYEKALAIQGYISRQIVYNLDAAETPIEKDPVEYSLFELKEGYCTAFASAMVVMARSVGIPARYVQGYLPDSRRQEKSGLYTITDADYHAWAELSFEGAGWVKFDPTIDAVSKEGYGLGDTGETKPWYLRTPVLVIAGIFLAVLSALLIGSASRRLPGIYRSATGKSDLDGQIIGFNRSLERIAGKRRLVGQTLSEFLVGLEGHLGAEYAAATSIESRFTKALFSQEPLSASEVALLQQDVRAFRKRVKSIRPVTLEATK